MDKPMEHLKQWHDLYQGTLTANETTLYIYLFMVANRRRWPEWVEITDSQLASGTNIRERTIPDVVNSLVQCGLIIGRRKKGRGPSAYQIVPLGENNYVKNDIINPRIIRDLSENNPRFIRDLSEINPRLKENSPCESKRGEAPNTTLHNTTQHNNKKPGKNDVYDVDGFSAFWSAYPNKLGKYEAAKSYAKLSPSAEMQSVLLQAVERFKTTEQWRKDNGQYIPRASTWLNQRRWEDEISLPASCSAINAIEDISDDEYERLAERYGISNSV